MPFQRHLIEARKRFDVSEVVYMDVEHERNMNSHREYFALIRNAFDNLPETMADAPFAKNEAALRKHALIATGFCDQSVVAAPSNEAAKQMAPAIDLMARRLHGYATTDILDALVICKVPQSQSLEAMGRKVFMDSKAKVLHWLANLIGVDPTELERNNNG